MQNDDQPTDSRGASQAAPDFAFAMLELKHLRQAMARHGDLLDQPVREFDIGERRFAFNSRRMLMGVINLSPDSAYRESVCRTPEEARARGMALIQAGADLVDIGAESSLPEADRVGPEAQIDRLRPVVKALCGQGAALSVESYYPEVLEACAQAGARVFNLTGSRDIPSVLALAARYQAAVIHCFVQGETVRQVVDYPPFETALDDVEAFLRTRLETAMAAGVTRNIIDPGLGFYYPNLTDGVSRVSL
ncbi:MAG: dihydropteroate synthase, partial [Deltaproteobacteria bacterium]|nr:dihydropteroate synthase [Deltaproteobacteria bacterium]